MLNITALENLNKEKSLKEQNINHTIYWAYDHSKEAGNDLIDFDEVIWEHDIEEMVTFFKENGIKEFTISSTFSSLIETLAEFEKQGCKMQGLTKVKSRHEDWHTGEKRILPAIKMSF